MDQGDGLLLVWNTRGKKSGICLEGRKFQGCGVSVWEIILSMWPVLECCLNLFEGLGSFLGFLDPVILV
jgi:hypothetical protein